MINTMFSKGSLSALETLMHFTTARHKAIANNIANAETTGYKAMDVPEKDFRTALARAFDAQRESPAGIFELTAHGGVRPTEMGLELKYLDSAETGILRHTENNVDIDMEMARLVKNAGRHNLAASILGQQYTMLREALSGRTLS